MNCFIVTLRFLKQANVTKFKLMVKFCCSCERSGQWCLVFGKAGGAAHVNDVTCMFYYS